MRFAPCISWKHYYYHLSLTSFLIAALLVVLPRNSSAQVTYLGDNSVQKVSSSLTDMLAKGDSVFFVALTSPATTSSAEFDLFVSDGTNAGTVNLTQQVKDSVANYDQPEFLTLLGNEVLFSTELALYKTDGSLAGTEVIMDGLLGVGNLTTAGSYVYFRASDNVHGSELWRTDGTTAGTHMVKDIYPKFISSVKSSSPNDLMPLGNSVVFMAQTEEYGNELWISDGTEAGTQLIADFRAGTSSSAFGIAGVEFNGNLYFSFNPQDGNGMEVWKTDGTAAGTMLLKDIKAGSGSSNANQLFVHNNKLIINTLNDGIWASDGTDAGTVQLHTEGAYSGTNFGFLGSDFYFVGGDNWYKSDGTVAGTSMQLSFANGDVQFMGTKSGKHILALAEYINTNLAAQRGMEVWEWDGTSNAPVRIKDIWIGQPSGIPNTPNDAVYLEAGSNIFFQGNDGTGTTLWITDGTDAGTEAVAYVNTNGINVAYPAPPYIANVGAEVYFPVQNQTGELWKSDGTLAGTVKIANTDSLTGVLGSNIHHIGGSTVIWRQDEVLWVSDGTTAGTHSLTSGAQNLAYIAGTYSHTAAVNGKVVFSSDVVPGVGFPNAEPWVTDGTVAGTMRLADTKPGNGQSNAGYPKQFVTAGSHVFFESDDDLWVTDGTPGGTLVLDTDGPTYPGVEFQGMYVDGGVTGGLRISDGTVAGTTTLNSHPGSGPITNLMASDSLVLYTITTGSTSYRGVWASDGTESGTERISTSASSSTYHSATSLGDTTYYLEGAVLWQTDGTQANTKKVFATSPAVYAITRYNNALYMVTGGNTASSSAMWKFDGDPLTMVQVPGTEDLVGFHSLHVNGNILYFHALGAAGGDELYAYQPNPNPEITVRYQELQNDQASITVLPNGYVSTNPQNLSGFTATGSIDFEESTSRTGYVISNSGNSALTLSTPTFSGTDAGQFSLVGFPTSIPASSVAEFEVHYTGGPNHGYHTVPLTFNTNDPNYPTYSIEFYSACDAAAEFAMYNPGFGLDENPNTGAEVSFLTDNIRSFEQAAIGATSTDTFIVANAGTGLPLVIDSITFAGPAAADYSVLSISNTSIKPSRYYTYSISQGRDSIFTRADFRSEIVVQFAPSAAGLRLANLQVHADNAGNLDNEPEDFILSLRGVGACDDVGYITPGEPDIVCTGDSITLTLPPVSGATYCWGNVGWSNIGSQLPTPRNAKLAVNSAGEVFIGSVSPSSKTNVHKLNNGTFTQVGAADFGNYSQAFNYNDWEFAINSADSMYFAYRDNSNGRKATVRKWDGSSWTPVGGEGFTPGQIEDIRLAFNSNDTAFVAFVDRDRFDRASVMKFNGTTWEYVGQQGFSIAAVEYMNLSIVNDTLYVAFKDGGHYTTGASVMKFNGSSWEYVGNPGFSVVEADYVSMDVNSSGQLYVGLSDQSQGINDNAIVYTFTGGSWQQVGAARFAYSSIKSLDMVVANDEPFVVVDEDNSFHFYSYSSGNWNRHESPQDLTSNIRYGSLAKSASGKVYSCRNYYNVANEVLEYDPGLNCLSTTNELTVSESGFYRVFVTDGAGTCTVGSQNTVEVRVIPCVPELEVFGNNSEISNGDTSPSTSDSTYFNYRFIGNTYTINYTLTNPGYDTLQIAGASFIDQDSALFSVVSQPPTSIAPGGSGTMSVSYTPLSTNQEQSTLQIVSNDATDSLYTFTVRGRGTYVTLTQTDSLLVDVDMDGGASVGDTMRYTLIVNNGALGSAFYPTVLESFSNSGVEAIPSSLVANAYNAPSVSAYDFQVTLNQLVAGASDTVSIDVVITSAPAGNIIRNQGKISSPSVLSDDPALPGLNDSTITMLTAPTCAVTLSIASTPSSCSTASDAVLTATAANGTSPYTYAWNNTAATAAAGSLTASTTYTVTVTDANGCTAEGSETTDYLCPTPVGLAATALQDTSVWWRWDATCGATAYKVRYKQAGMVTPWIPLVTNGNQGSLKFTGLIPNTTYRWTVQALCNGVWSTISAEEKFQTLPSPCAGPTMLSTTPVGRELARLNWAAAPNALRYRIRYRAQGDSNWTQLWKDGGKTHTWLINLSTATTYEWQIKSTCAKGDVLGTTWSATQTFTTAPAAKASTQVLSGSISSNEASLLVFPNPATSVATASIVLPEPMPIDIRLTDVVGNVVHQVQVHYNSGTLNVPLDLQGQAAGTYLLQVSSDAIRTQQLLIVQ